MQYNIFKHARNKKDVIFLIIHPFQKSFENVQGRNKKKEITSMKHKSLQGEFWKGFSILKAEQGKLE